MPALFVDKRIWFLTWCFRWWNARSFWMVNLPVGCDDSRRRSFDNIYKVGFDHAHLRVLDHIRLCFKDVLRLSHWVILEIRSINSSPICNMTSVYGIRLGLVISKRDTTCFLNFVSIGLWVLVLLEFNDTLGRAKVLFYLLWNIDFPVSW